MSLLIKKAGILTTVQDLGRQGYRRLGINPGGAMDRTAVRLLNILLGNKDNEAVLEMHFPAPQIIFESDSLIAIGGADFAPEVNGEAIAAWRPYYVGRGSKLTFTARRSGNRAYLALYNGLDLPSWLGSMCTNLAARIGGFNGRRLEDRDRIPVRRDLPAVATAVTTVSSSLIPRYSRFPTVRVIAGAEFGLLDNRARDLFAGQSFEVSTRSDRMGFRLSGPDLHLEGATELVSAAVDFGTIQLLPDGQLIVLMAESQTAGGYPRVAHVASVDLPLLAQLGAGDKVRFHLIDREHAEALALDAWRELSFFRVGCRLQAQSWTS